MIDMKDIYSTFKVPPCTHSIYVLYNAQHMLFKHKYNTYYAYYVVLHSMHHICLSSVDGVIVTLPKNFPNIILAKNASFSPFPNEFYGRIDIQYLLLGHAGQRKAFWQPLLPFAHFL